MNNEIKQFLNSILKQIPPEYMGEETENLIQSYIQKELDKSVENIDCEFVIKCVEYTEKINKE